MHPEKELRLSPYAYVDINKDLTFSFSEFKESFSTSMKHNFGTYDGSGEPIKLTLFEYYERFIYDEDYVASHVIGNNQTIGQGNTLNNIKQEYPEASFIEFHFTGFEPEFEGLDWKSLILVFEFFEGQWHLVGIVHNEWTI